MINTIEFNKNLLSSYSLENEISLLSWLNTICAKQVGAHGYFYAPTWIDSNILIGSWYYKLIKENQVLHVSGLENAPHFIKLPIAFINQVADTKEIDTFDEKGIKTGIEFIDILNKDIYQIPHKNEINCLVKITDQNFATLFLLIDFATIDFVENTPVNMICSDKYIQAISEGGEFYQPEKPIP